MKAKVAHRVPLSGPAMAVLEGMKAVRQSDYIFPGARPLKPLSNMACLAVLDRMNERERVVVHGFRSSFWDWCAERTTFPHHVAEMALAHVIANKAEAAYRRGDLFQKRRLMMDAWAKHCAKTSVGSVVAIRKAA